MAIDVITGKPFTPKFEGQRTGVDFANEQGIEDEQALEDYLTRQWGQGAAQGGVQSVYEPYEGAFPGGMNTATGQYEEMREGDPVTRDVWYVNNQRMTQAGLDRRIAEAKTQLMGGVGTDNPFLRTETGLEGWQPMDASGKFITGGVPLVGETEAAARARAAGAIRRATS